MPNPDTGYVHTVWNPTFETNLTGHWSTTQDGQTVYEVSLIHRNQTLHTTYFGAPAMLAFAQTIIDRYGKTQPPHA